VSHRVQHVSVVLGTDWYKTVRPSSFLTVTVNDWGLYSSTQDCWLGRLTSFTWPYPIQVLKTVLLNKQNKLYCTDYIGANFIDRLLYRQSLSSEACT